MFLILGFGLLVKAVESNKMTKFQHHKTIFYTGHRIFKVKNFTRGRGFCKWGKDDPRTRWPITEKSGTFE